MSFFSQRSIMRELQYAYDMCSFYMYTSCVLSTCSFMLTADQSTSLNDTTSQYMILTQTYILNLVENNHEWLGHTGHKHGQVIMYKMFIFHFTYRIYGKHT